MIAWDCIFTSDHNAAPRSLPHPLKYNRCPLNPGIRARRIHAKISKAIYKHALNSKMVKALKMQLRAIISKVWDFGSTMISDGLQELRLQNATLRNSFQSLDVNATI